MQKPLTKAWILGYVTGYAAFAVALPYIFKAIDYGFKLVVESRGIAYTTSPLASVPWYIAVIFCGVCCALGIGFRLLDAKIKTKKRSINKNGGMS